MLVLLKYVAYFAVVPHPRGARLLRLLSVDDAVAGEDVLALLAAALLGLVEFVPFGAVEPMRQGLRDEAALGPEQDGVA